MEPSITLLIHLVTLHHSNNFMSDAFLLLTLL